MHKFSKLLKEISDQTSTNLLYKYLYTKKEDLLKKYLKIKNISFASLIRPISSKKLYRIIKFRSLRQMENILPDWDKNESNYKVNNFVSWTKKKVNMNSEIGMNWTHSTFCIVFIVQYDIQSSDRGIDYSIAFPEYNSSLFHNEQEVCLIPKRKVKILYRLFYSDDFGEFHEIMTSKNSKDSIIKIAKNKKLFNNAPISLISKFYDFCINIPPSK